MDMTASFRLFDNNSGANMIKYEKVNTDEDVLYIIGWILLLFFGLTSVVYNFFPTFLKQYLPPCMFLKLTGLYCPGCGGTRAVLALFKGKVLSSFVYHPFVLYTGIIGGGFMTSQSVERITRGKWAVGMKYKDIYLWIALLIVIVNFLIKNILLLKEIDMLAG